MRQEFVDRVIALGKPVVSINYDLRGARTVGTDNYAAMRGLVERILKDHDCQQLAFVNGLASSVEAQARAQAYRDVCTERGLVGARFYQADWQMESGIEVAHKLLHAPDDLPEVIFCCNDDIAIGVQQTLLDAGVRIPEDVKITGFDNRENSLRAVPRITTVDRDFVGIGRCALATVLEMLDGEEVSGFRASEVLYVLAASCGYDHPSNYQDSVVENLYTMDNALKMFYAVLMSFHPALLAAGTTGQVLRECELRLGELRCPEVFLTINEDYLASWNTGVETLTYGEASLLGGYVGTSDELTCDKDHVYARFASRQLLPEPLLADPGLAMVFPVRQGTTYMGALVTRGVSPVLRYGFLTFLLSILASALESLRQRSALNAMNERLDDLYTHDQLTGLHNRFGLEREGTSIYERMLCEHGTLQVIFVDVDDMKGINDHYGHDEGDRALKDTALVIRRGCADTDSFCMRYGGDEFLVISSTNLIPKLREELAMFKTSEERPYDLKLSMGAYPVFVGERCSVQEAIHRADMRMYKSKRAQKKGDDLVVPPEETSR
jgi:diguanylate cyclase (GGDEF)-like protein